MLTIGQFLALAPHMPSMLRHCGKVGLVFG